MARSEASVPMPAMDGFRVEAFFPNFHDESWVSYTLKSVMEGVASDRVRVGATVLAKGRGVTAAYVHPLIDRRLSRFVFPRFADPTTAVYRSGRRRLAAGDVAYFWLDGPARFCVEFRRRGVMVAREMINCTLKLKRDELRKAYAALGLPDLSNISDAMIEKEREDLLAADAIFCPNGFVRQSVVEYGVPADRCIQTSYGWDAGRLNGRGRAVPDDGAFTVAFVGTVDVRKGVPVLLEAWVRSGIRGRLLIAGQMREEIAIRFDHVLSRSDVKVLGYVRDVGSVYRSADVFCFPSWEEGGPQVTLEAMGIGAVPVVTPMGTAGAFSEHEDVGIVIAPGDVEALAGALRELWKDRDRLAHLKRRTLARAAEYTWERVGMRRREALMATRERWLNSVRCA